MKLINKESNAVYSSPTLEWDEDWRCYRDYAPTLHEFHKEDGWEEVGDEKDFVTKWQKQANNLLQRQRIQVSE